MATTVLGRERTAEEIQEWLDDFSSQRFGIAAAPAPETLEANDAALDAALKEIWETVPDASWERFPADFGKNMDCGMAGNRQGVEPLPYNALKTRTP